MSKEKDPKEDIEKLKQECEEYLDGWKRAKADLANYKKDEFKRLEELVRFANEDIIIDLLNILDSFDLALQAMEKSGEVEKGVYLIQNQLEDLLRRRGLEKMDVQEGQMFDPSMQEAVMTVEGSNEKDGLIAEGIEKGYVLNGKVVRPAKVKVYKHMKK